MRLCVSCLTSRNGGNPQVAATASPSSTRSRRPTAQNSSQLSQCASIGKPPYSNLIRSVAVNRSCTSLRLQCGHIEEKKMTRLTTKQPTPGARQQLSANLQCVRRGHPTSLYTDGVDDANTNTPPDRRAALSDRLHCGNFSSRSIAWKRGSLRSGSRSGSVFSSIKPPSRSRYAVSNHSSAVNLLPHCAYVSAY